MKNPTLSHIGSPLIKRTIQNTAAYFLQKIAKANSFNPNDNVCQFAGSIDNQSVVIDALVEKYGHEVASAYDPAVNVLPKTRWLQLGYIIKPEEQALCFIHSYRSGSLKTVALYWKEQVELAI